MSDELERLCDELKRLRFVSDEHKDLMGYRSNEITKAIECRVEEIAALEADADPWQEAKKRIEIWRAHGNTPCVVSYVGHLTAKGEAQRKQIDWLHTEYNNRGLQISELVAENARLEKRVAELEQNSVWGIHSQVDGHLIKAFLTREEAEEELEKDTSKPRFKEVRVSDAKKIVKALNTSQKHESMFRVERDKAWKRVAELEKASEIVRRLAEPDNLSPCEIEQAIRDATILWNGMLKGAGDDQAK